MFLPYRHLVWDKGFQQLPLPLCLPEGKEGHKKAGEWDPLQVPPLLLENEWPIRRLHPPPKLKNEKTYT